MFSISYLLPLCPYVATVYLPSIAIVFSLLSIVVLKLNACHILLFTSPLSVARFVSPCTVHILPLRGTTWGSTLPIFIPSSVANNSHVGRTDQITIHHPRHSGLTDYLWFQLICMGSYPGHFATRVSDFVDTGDARLGRASFCQRHYRSGFRLA